MHQSVKIGFGLFNILILMVLLGFQSLTFDLSSGFTDINVIELEEEIDVMNNNCSNSSDEHLSGGEGNDSVAFLNENNHPFNTFIFSNVPLCKVTCELKKSSTMPFYIQNCSLTLYA